MRMSINQLEELRMRRWARENYVPEDLRRKDWHPVILEEMLIKDQEMGRQNPTTELRFVPLMDNLVFRLDQAHIEQFYVTPLSTEMTMSELFIGVTNLRLTIRNY